MAFTDKIHHTENAVNINVHLTSAAVGGSQDGHLDMDLDFIDRVTSRVMLEAIMEHTIDLLDMMTFYRNGFSQPGNSTHSGTSSAVTSSVRYKPHDPQSRRIQTLVMFAVVMNHKEYREAVAALKRIAQKERDRGKRTKKIYYS